MQHSKGMLQGKPRDAKESRNMIQSKQSTYNYIVKVHTRHEREGSAKGHSGKHAKIERAE